jgi:hypothetical protein
MAFLVPDPYATILAACDTIAISPELYLTLILQLLGLNAALGRIYACCDFPKSLVHFRFDWPSQSRKCSATVSASF